MKVRKYEDGKVVEEIEGSPEEVEAYRNKTKKPVDAPNIELKPVSKLSVELPPKVGDVVEVVSIGPGKIGNNTAGHIKGTSYVVIVDTINPTPVGQVIKAKITHVSDNCAFANLCEQEHEPKLNPLGPTGRFRSVATMAFAPYKFGSQKVKALKEKGMNFDEIFSVIYKDIRAVGTPKNKAKRTTYQIVYGALSGKGDVMI